MEAAPPENPEQFEQQLRQNVVNAIKSFRARFLDPDEATEHFYFTGEGLDENNVKSFFRASNCPPDKQGHPKRIGCRPVDCKAAVAIVMAKGLIDTLKPGEFDQLRLHPTNPDRTYDMRMIQSRVLHIDQLKTGDTVYFENCSSYNKCHNNDFWQGENVIKVGRNEKGEPMFWGFDYVFVNNGSCCIKTYEDWRNTLLAQYNDDPTNPLKEGCKRITIDDIPHYDPDKHPPYFFDIPALWQYGWITP